MWVTARWPTERLIPWNRLAKNAARHGVGFRFNFLYFGEGVEGRKRGRRGLSTIHSGRWSNNCRRGFVLCRAGDAVLMADCSLLSTRSRLISHRLYDSRHRHPHSRRTQFIQIESSAHDFRNSRNKFQHPVNIWTSRTAAKYSTRLAAEYGTSIFSSLLFQTPLQSNQPRYLTSLLQFQCQLNWFELGSRLDLLHFIATWSKRNSVAFRPERDPTTLKRRTPTYGVLTWVLFAWPHYHKKLK